MDKQTEFYLHTQGGTDIISGRFTCLTQEDVDLYVRKMRVLKPLLARRSIRPAMLIRGGLDAEAAICPAT